MVKKRLNMFLEAKTIVMLKGYLSCWQESNADCKFIFFGGGLLLSETLVLLILINSKYNFIFLTKYMINNLCSTIFASKHLKSSKPF